MFDHSYTSLLLFYTKLPVIISLHIRQTQGALVSHWKAKCINFASFILRLSSLVRSYYGAQLMIQRWNSNSGRIHFITKSQGKYNIISGLVGQTGNTWISRISHFLSFLVRLQIHSSTSQLQCWTLLRKHKRTTVSCFALKIDWNQDLTAFNVDDFIFICCYGGQLLWRFYPLLLDLQYTQYNLFM